MFPIVKCDICGKEVPIFHAKVIAREAGNCKCNECLERK